MLLLTFYSERKNGYRKRACKVKLVIGWDKNTLLANVCPRKTATQSKTVPSTLDYDHSRFCQIKHATANVSFPLFGSLTIGFERFPSSRHSSYIVCRPTSRTTNSPTNFTPIVHASAAPVNDNQNHQDKVNGCSRSDATRAMPHVAHIMKHNNIGSKRMYWFSVNRPTSAMTRRLTLRHDKVISRRRRSPLRDQENTIYRTGWEERRAQRREWT